MINQRNYSFIVGHGPGICSQIGCTICCIAEIIGTDPKTVNDRLLAVDGFSGNLVKWAWIEKAFPGVKAYRYYGYDNAFVKSCTPNVMCEVSASAIGGLGKHWIVYKGNQQCGDPWTGKIRPTSDFGTPTGYTTITGKWSGLPTTTPIVPVLTQIHDVVYSGIQDTQKVLKIQAILPK